MRTGFITFLFSIFSVTCSFAADMGGPKEVEALTAKEQAMIPIAALTAAGDMERLKPALEKGLDAGLSVNEIKEILIQLYAYCGFPRSLNGINAFMEVMKVREAEGIKDTVGKAASPLPKGMDRDAYGAEVRRKLMGVTEEPPAQGYQLFTPVMDTYLKEHLFADIFARDVLDHRSRELVTISALAAMPGTEGQLRFHLGAAMNTGLSADQMAAFVAVLESKVGVRAAESVRQLLRDLLTAGDG
ncbi:carboxymuconolactone decarboxylase family protein [Sulfurimonas diazotrophicus]|uniref:Carboxymuconolactone decarboxylase family protein n=1 Tax=Sulfurimonas diazotrophicus TaxID=3131939 RepID=A0ABZ3HDV2_9BACT